MNGQAKQTMLAHSKIKHKMTNNLKFQPIILISAFFLAMLIPSLSNAQWQDYRGQLDDPNVPAFVKALSVAQPNVNEVAKLYEEYYTSVIAPLKAAHKANPATANLKFKHEFEHLYKTWKIQTANYVTADGYVDFSQKADEARNEVINRIHPPASMGAENGTWKPMGPMNVVRAEDNKPISWQANIFCMARSNVPGLTQLMYAGTEAGGLFKSVDTGSSWYQVGTNQNFSTVQAVAYWPWNSDYVRIGVSGKIMYSDDGGGTWTQSPINPNGGTISPDFQTYDILFSTQNLSGKVFAATSDGLLISEDYGKTWTKRNLVNAAGARVTSIVEHPTNPAILYILIYDPVTKMTTLDKTFDYGVTWYNSPDAGWFEIPAADAGKFEVWGGRIAVTPAAPERIYVMLNGFSQPGASLQLNGFVGIYQEDDGGNWSRKTGPLGAPYNQSDRPNLVSWGTFPGPGSPYAYNQVTYLNNAIVASTTNADRLYVGGLTMWESTNAGTSWTPKGGYSNVVPYIHPDIRRFLIRNTSATTEELFWASDGGINFSADGTLESHEARNNGIFANDLWGFTADKRLGLMGGGSYHNGNNFTHTANFPAGVWKHAGGGETATGYMQYGPNPRAWFVEYPAFGINVPSSSNQASSGYSSILDQDQWRPNGPIGYDDYRASRILFSKLNPQHIYWGSKSKFCQSTDDGKTAKVLYDFGGSNIVEWVEQSPANPKVLYLKVEGKDGQGNPTWQLYKTADGGYTWATAGGLETKNFFFALVSDDYLYRAYQNNSNGQKVWLSDNAGATWSNITTATLNDLEIGTILSLEGVENDLYVATNKGGVFNYNYFTAQWDNISQGLSPAITPTRLSANYSTKKLQLGTRGMGVWEVDFNNNPVILDITVASDFNRNFCLGESIHFINRSNSSESSVYSWSFAGGTPGVSSIENPTVSYSNAGTYPVSLTITDNLNNINSSVTLAGYVTVVSKTTLPYAETFEGGSFHPEWALNDANQNGVNWTVNNGVGGFGGSQSCMKFDNFNSDEKGSRDEVRTHKVDMSNITSANLQFDVAYTNYADSPTVFDSLAVLVSTDCGKTFTHVFLDGGAGLSTAPPTNNAFTPTSTQWTEKMISLQPYLGNDEVLFVFQNRGNYGNNLYVDNINVTGISKSVEEEAIQQSLVVIPNPNQGQFKIRFDLAQSINGRLSLTDPLGREVYRSEIQSMGGLFEQQIQVENLSAGLYLLRIQGEGVEIVHKVLIQK